MAEASPPRFTLRQLPLPAKLVLTVFLLTVGVGYTSAMLQLHMQHSDRDGTPLPTKANVISIFSGWKEPTDEVCINCSKLEEVISGPRDGKIAGTNMAPAFFAEDGGEFKEKARTARNLEALMAEREGERQVILAWIRSPSESRQEAFESNKFTLPKELLGKPITPGYKPGPDSVNVRQILIDRCKRCHQPGGEKAGLPLTTYQDYAAFMPKDPVVVGGWVSSGQKMDLKLLTQSTHAHLLSFAMLYSLTGLIFAFTSYPVWVRAIVSPLVLIAQVADISCWWLARLDPPYGPGFAMAIIGTGGVVGLGLMAQIAFSLLNMYTFKGKLVLLVILVLLGGAVGPLVVREALKLRDEEIARSAGEKKPNGKPAAVEAPKLQSNLDRVLDRKPDSQWGKGPGGMVRAFFDKESAFNKVMKNGDEDEKKTITAERDGELAAIVAWLKLPEDKRKGAFKDDKFPLPPELIGKPITDSYIENDTVKVQSILADRCLKCHADGGEQEPALETYEQILEQLKPKATDNK